MPHMGVPAFNRSDEIDRANSRALTDRRSVGCRLRLPSTIDPVSSFSRFSIASFEFHRSFQIETRAMFRTVFGYKIIGQPQRILRPILRSVDAAVSMRAHK